MTKAGEGNLPSKEPTVEKYHRDLEQSTLKFLHALEQYEHADEEEKTRLKGNMDLQIQIIRSTVKELKRTGMHKQEVKVENDYKAYMKEGGAEALAALKHDIETIRESNKRP